MEESNKCHTVAKIKRINLQKLNATNLERNFHNVQTLNGADNFSEKVPTPGTTFKECLDVITHRRQVSEVSAKSILLFSSLHFFYDLATFSSSNQVPHELKSNSRKNFWCEVNLGPLTLTNHPSSNRCFCVQYSLHISKYHTNLHTGSTGYLLLNRLSEN